MMPSYIDRNSLNKYEGYDIIDSNNEYEWYDIIDSNIIGANMLDE